MCRILVILLLLSPNLLAENWPGWRGPRGDGSSLSQKLPTSWNATNGQNILWKKSMPANGHASPIVWGDRIFISGCDLTTNERLLICLDRKTGDQVWKKTVFTAPLESIHGLNSRASATPVTDGSLIYVTYLKVDGRKIPAPNVGSPRLITPGEIVVAAFDFDGNKKWLVTPGPFISAHGFSNCPILYDDLVIVNGDHDGDSYVVALEKSTGKERWRIDREHKTRSYSTPLVREIDGKPQMVFSGSKRVVALDPRSGTMLWKIEGPTEQFVASMVYEDGLFFMNCGYPDHFVMGIRIGGNGDVTDTHVAWESRSARSYVPSPVVLNGFLMVADDRGTANCFDTKSGKRHWNTRLGKGFNSSLVHAGGLVFFTSTNGITKIVQPDGELKIVGEGHLGEDVSASPAIAHDQLFIRGHETLFCIGQSQN